VIKKLESIVYDVKQSLSDIAVIDFKKLAA
jgi:hypothetical protein